MGYKYAIRYSWMQYPTGTWGFNREITTDNLFVFVAKALPILIGEKIVDIEIRK